MRNLIIFAACAGGGYAMMAVTEKLLSPARRLPIAELAGVPITTNLIQWSAVAIGAYATAGWIGAGRLRDPVVARLIVRSPAFGALAVGGGLISFASYGLSAFLFVYASRYLGATAQDGTLLGVIQAISGLVGTNLGGVLADAARRRHRAGRVYLASGAVALAAGALAVQYSTLDFSVFLIGHFLATLFTTIWLGPIFATAQDLVLPRLRGTAIAILFLGINLIGLGLGPYAVGLLSDATGSLRLAMLSALGAIPLAIFSFLVASRHLAAAETRLRECVEDDAAGVTATAACQV